MMNYVKKIFSLLLVAVLALNFISTALAAETGEYIVVGEMAPIYENANILSKKIAEIFFGAYVEVTEIKNSFGKIALPSAGISGWVQLSALKKTCPVQETDITGIEIAPPVKTVYIDGCEQADNAGMEVFAVYKDGTKTAVTGYVVYMPELKGLGEKTATVTYSPKNTGKTFTAYFEIRIVRVPVKALELVSPPDKTSYNENDILDLSGLTVKTIFEDENDNRISSFEDMANDPDYSITGLRGEVNGDKLEKGVHTFTISYKYEDISCSFNIDVRPRKLISVTLKKPPDVTTVYTNTVIPSIDGVILEAEYDNGEKEEKYYYDCTVVCDPASFVIGPGNKVDVFYKDFKVTIEFRYILRDKAGIKLTLPKILSFHLGDNIDLSELRVFLYYNDNTTEEVYDYDITPVDPNIVGTQNIVVSYGEFSDVFSIYISQFFGIGDIDGDGKITAADARQTLRGAVGLIKLAGLTFNAADVDKDGKITAADARIILRAAVGLEEFRF